MRTIKSILERKSKELVSISPDKTVFEALKIMADKNIGSVLVMEKGNYLGILSERNYARQIVLLDKSSKEVLVEEIMRTDLPILSQSDNINTCMEIMSRLNVRYLPVKEEDTLVGLISIKDILDEILLHQQGIIDDLTNYISS